MPLSSVPGLPAGWRPGFPVKIRTPAAIEKRRRLRVVAARVVVSARRVVFHLSSSYPLRELFGSVLERITVGASPGRAGVG